MRKFLYIFNFLSMMSYGQSGNFSKSYSGVSDDLSFFHLDTVHDGGYILSGSSFTLTGGDFIVLKTDSLGNEQWRYVNNDYTINGLDNIAITVKETVEHCFIVIGKIHISSSNYYDFKVAKIDSLGGLLWNRNYNYSFNDQALDLFCEKDTSFYLFGRVDTSIIAIKFNSFGDTIFSKRIGNYSCFNLISNVSRDGNSFILSGVSYSPPTFEYLNLIKIDSLFNVKWCKTYADTLIMATLWDVKIDTNGNYLVAGAFTNPSGPSYLQIFSIDTLGTMVGKRLLNLRLYGTFLNDTTLATTLPNNTSNPDSLFLGTYNLISNSNNYYGGFLANHINGIGTKIDKQKSILYYGSIDDGNTSEGFLMKVKKPSTLSVSEINNSNFVGIQIFEDLANKEIHFKIPDIYINKNKKPSLCIFNTLGSKIKSTYVNNTDIKISVREFSSGTYFYSFTNDGVKLSSGKFIIH